MDHLSWFSMQIHGVLCSLIFRPLFIVASDAEAAAAAAPIQFDFRRNNIYLFIFIIWFIHRSKKFNFNICESHIAHSHTRARFRMRAYHGDGWDICVAHHTRFVNVCTGVYCLTIAFLIIRFWKVSERMHCIPKRLHNKIKHTTITAAHKKYSWASEQSWLNGRLCAWVN